ncbi:MAG: hypothetical protein ACI9LM_002843 [Alteromonadaceae bacterium]|jgi:hypothetical protein
MHKYSISIQVEPSTLNTCHVKVNQNRAFARNIFTFNHPVDSKGKYLFFVSFSMFLCVYLYIHLVLFHF